MTTTTDETEKAGDRPADDTGEGSAAESGGSSGGVRLIRRGADAGGSSGGDRPAGGRARWYAGAAFLLALAIMVAGLMSWRSAVNDADTLRAEARDAALIAATENIETLNTMDYRDVDAGLTAWRDATTGTLRDQLTQLGKNERKLLTDQSTISEGKVVDAAVLSLDDETATVLASVEVTILDDTQPDAEPTVRRHRFSANLVLVDGEWLLETLDQVAVSMQ